MLVDDDEYEMKRIKEGKRKVEKEITMQRKKKIKKIKIWISVIFFFLWMRVEMENRFCIFS